MEKFISPKPFRTAMQAREYLSSERLQCLLCGQRFKSLGQHLRSAHQMTKTEYHLKFRIPHTYTLACPTLAARLSKLEQERGARDASYATRRRKILDEGREDAHIARIDKRPRRSPLLPDAFEIDDTLRGMSKAERMAYLRAKLAEPRK